MLSGGCRTPRRYLECCGDGRWGDRLAGELSELLRRHWSQIATVVELTTRYTVLVHVTSRRVDAVSEGLSREMAKLPDTVRRTLTWDRGMELANHPEVTNNTGLAVFLPIHTVRGNGGRMRTRTDCCASTSRRACRSQP